MANNKDANETRQDADYITRRDKVKSNVMTIDDIASRAMVSKANCRDVTESTHKADQCLFNLKTEEVR